MSISNTPRLRPSLKLCTAILAFSAIQTASAFDCSIQPVYIDIHAREVHGTEVFQIGAFIGVGSPAQNQSLSPSLRQNQTSVASIDFCKNSKLANCSISTHGNFDESASSSWSQEENYKSLDKTTPIGNSTFGTEVFHLYTHYFESNPAWETNVNSTLEVADSGNNNPGIVGLGQNSTLLQSLADSKIIAGRTLSYYGGSNTPRAGGSINGSISWGGYDAGRFVEPTHQYNMDLSNADFLPLTVTDIRIASSDGATNVSLLDSAKFPNLGKGNHSFTGRLSTDQFPLSLPYQITQNFIKTLSAVPSDYTDGSLRISKPFNGSMTFTLSDGFQVTLPHDVLYNVSGISPVADRKQDDNSPFYLTLPFLAQVYLMMDYEASVFHLATAVQDNNIDYNKYVMPTTFCPHSTPKMYKVPSKSDFKKNGLIGALIGGTIAGIALTTLSVFIIMLCRQQRHINRKEKEERILARRLKTLQTVGFEPMEEVKENDRERTPLVRKVKFWA
ncbi:hypothetical protein NA57DRAFT_43748 [Rhizodiscina lignyota]|uniref:Acid protease n=1 Tax=Rhizodiscina lignyota TaxID=1504668 RepID=A0A9P4I9H8_9PEZI|nr:hypothetical protein NA57DRAFT_43748 [Rhizodiscina lignyota]